MPTPDETTRLARIESKLDAMADNMILLARIDERQTAHMEKQTSLGERVGGVERRVAELEKASHQAGPFIRILQWIVVAVISALVSWFASGRQG
jgi:hypothetical protein